MAKVDVSETLRLLGRPMSLYPTLTRAIGIKESVFVCQLLYWTPRSKAEQGWVYKSAEDLEAETGLTYKEQIRVRKSVVAMKLVEERHDRTEHRLYFRLDTEALNTIVEQFTNSQLPSEQMTEGKEAPAQTSEATLPTVSSYKEAETTQESTHIKPSPLFAEDVKPASELTGPDPRHTVFKELIFRFYQWKWKRKPGWDGSDAAQLSRLLKANPELDAETFAHWLRNYGESKDITPGERPRRFLPRIENYSVRPLNSFGRDGSTGNGKASQAEERNKRITDRVKRYAATQGVTVDQTRKFGAGDSEGVD